MNLRRPGTRWPSTTAGAFGRTRLRDACVWLVLFGASPAIALDRDAYREDLVGLVQIVADIQARMGPDAPGSRVQMERAARLYAGFSDEQVDVLARSLPESQLHAVVTQSRRLLQMPRTARIKTAVVSVPDVSPSFCNDYPAPVALAALGTKLVTRFVIESLEFTCSESVLGTNAALGCEAPEIAAASADIASRLADFCGGQQSAATNRALLDTERSVGRHLELQLDVPLSTRATQASIDAANSGMTSADAKAAELRALLDPGFARIDAQIADATDELGGLAADVSEIQSRTDDIAFRVQVTQVDVEDVQDRSADLQARAGELQASLSASVAAAAASDDSASALGTSLEANTRQQRRDDLEAALGDPDAQMSLIALPASVGGGLEEAREVLIATIIALQALGQGNTAQALLLLDAGDQHYNAGRYAEAWRQFGAAYRTLDPHTPAKRGATP